MFRVLIAEDETILRKALIGKVDWAKLRLELAGEAADGQEALLKVAELQPEIVITDIRMPEMDGLQFIAKAQAENPQIRFIIVSGYNDFDYARQAIQLGVVDYLLKPVVPDELNQVLTNVQDELCREGQQVDYQFFLETNYQIFQELVQDREFTHLISETATSQEVENIRTIFLNRSLHLESLMVLLFQIENPDQMGSTQDLNGLIERGNQIINECFTKLTTYPGLVFKHVHHPAELVIVLTNNRTIDLKLIRQWVDDTTAVLQKALQSSITVGIGTPASFPTIRQSYLHAQSASRTKILKGGGRIYDFQAIQLSNQSVTAAPSSLTLNGEQERLLFSFLDAGKTEQVLEWLEAQVGAIVASPRSVYQDLESRCIEIIVLFRKYLQGQTVASEFVLGVHQDFLNFLAQLGSWTEALTELERQAKAIIGLVKSGKEQSGENIVSEVKDYIAQHYFENLSLNWVAERYFIHPNYFSQLFKETYHESFKDCIIRVRMAKALELIKNPAMNIEQIAQLVGYDDPAYFSKVFRNTHGVAPSKFREK